MKKLTIILALNLLFLSSYATIFRLGYPGVGVVGKDFIYTDYSGLEAAASNGDTVQVYQQFFPNNISIQVTKSLKIVGYGFNLNTNTGYQVANLPDITQRGVDLYLASGSAGSVIEGIHCISLVMGDSNLTIKRCLLYRNDGWNCFQMGSAGNLNNLLVQGCYFKSVPDSIANSNGCTTSFGIYYGWTESLKNFRFVNNIVEGRFFIPNIQFNNSTIPNPASGLVANNVFIAKKGMQNYTTPIFEIQGTAFFYIKNNIFYYDSVTAINIWGQSFFSEQIKVPLQSIVQNNTSNIPSVYNQWGATNQWGVSNLFVAGFNNGYYASESSLQLAAGSPALTAGKNNAGAATQCGVFGGEAGQVYKLSGIPSIPAIYQLTAPSINATTNPYNITTSTRSNN